MKKTLYTVFLLWILAVLAACGEGEKKAIEDMKEQGLPAHEDREMTGQDTLDLERGRGSND